MIAAARVAVQVVSDTRFSGAGLTFREGLSVRGLNIAATVWCSAAVGVRAGREPAGLRGGATSCRSNCAR